MDAKGKIFYSKFRILKIYSTKEYGQTPFEFKKILPSFSHNISILLIIRWRRSELPASQALTILGSCPLTNEFLINMFKVGFCEW